MYITFTSKKSECGRTHSGFETPEIQIRGTSGPKIGHVNVSPLPPPKKKNKKKNRSDKIYSNKVTWLIRNYQINIISCLKFQKLLADEWFRIIRAWPGVEN